MPQLEFASYPSQLFWLAVVFGCLYIFLSRYALPALSETLEERRRLTQGRREETEAALSRAREAEAAYDAARGEAREAARARARRIEEEARQKLDGQKEAHAAALKERVSGAEAGIAVMTEKSAGAIEAAAVRTAQLIVERLTGGETSAAQASRAVRRAKAEG